MNKRQYDPLSCLRSEVTRRHFLPIFTKYGRVLLILRLSVHLWASDFSPQWLLCQQWYKYENAQEYLQCTIIFVIALNVIPLVVAKQIYEPSSLLEVAGMWKLLPLCNIELLPTLFQVISGFGHPVAAQLRTTESVTFRVNDVLGLWMICGDSVTKINDLSLSQLCESATTVFAQAKGSVNF